MKGIFLTSVFLIGFSTAAFAIGDIEAGKENSGVCVTCHGPNGESLFEICPKIANQHADYTYNQLLEYRKGQEGRRYEPSMYSIVASMSDKELMDLAVYYESLPPHIGSASKALVERGQRVYRGGVAKDGVPACMACHGPGGQGNKQADYPKLAGQQAGYVEEQIKGYRLGERKTDPNGIMKMISEKMSDADIKAVASYIEGLHQ